MFGWLLFTVLLQKNNSFLEVSKNAMIGIEKII